MLPVWLTDTLTSDLDRALHYTLLWGLEGVALRTVGSAAERVPRVNEAKVQRRMAESEMLPAALAPGLFEGPLARRAAWMNDLATFGETLAFAERIGCPRIVVGSFGAEEDGAEEDSAPGDGALDEAALEQAAGALRRAGAAAERRGRTLAVQNAVGMACPTGAALARLLRAADHPAVCAAWSPADALRAGEAPAAGLEALAGRVALVRCYDGVPDAGGPDAETDGWAHAPLGEGALDWPAQLKALSRQGFAGPVSLELYVEPKPTHGLRSATTLIRMIRAARRAG